jgi:VIT1/CCC1 family predicted Fe2+/Mn2+ transporter
MSDFLETVITVLGYLAMGVERWVVSFIGFIYGVLYLIIHFVLVRDLLHAIISLGVAILVNGFFAGVNQMIKDNRDPS